MTWSFLCFVLITLSVCTSSTSALKILGISTLPSPSHHIWFTKFMNGLARNGHEIYTLGLEPTKFDVDKVKENQTTSIVFEGMMESFGKSGAFEAKEWSGLSPIDAEWSIYLVSHEICKMQMNTQGAKRVLELVKNTKFDVIVQDVTCGQCFYGLREAAQGNPPLVGYTPFGSPSWVKAIVGGNNWPAIKQYHLYPETAPLTLWKKIVNVAYYEIDDILRQYFYLPVQQELAEKYIGKKLSRSLDEIEKNITVMLVNTYAALDAGTFLPPNAIEVGGLQVTDPKPLPQDIKEFFDGAEHGVVIMSLGTNVKTSVLGPDRLKAIVTALGKLKQRVLWKFDADNLANKPKNVMIKKWIPQSDILAHPKVRVIWTHSGLLSAQEAVWRGIPIIGMPFFLDQDATIDNLVKRGVGLRLDFETLSTKTVSETLERILTDPSFDRRMKQLSLEYRDRPMSPLDLAVWHVEYAARHPRGPLASPGRYLSRFQLNLLDVYALLGVTVFLILWILRFLLRSLFSLLCSQRKTKTTQKKLKSN